MSSEKIPNPFAERARAVVGRYNAEHVWHLGRGAGLLADALGLPQARKYEVMSGLGADVASAITRLGAATDSQSGDGGGPEAGETPQR